jgi:hypothetical protein
VAYDPITGKFTPSGAFQELPKSTGTPFGQTSGAPAASAAQVQQFTSGVSSAQAEFNKSLANAKKLLSDAKKEKNDFLIDSARNLINTLNTVVKPTLDTLAIAENPFATYTGGNVSDINKAMGSGAAGSGPAGAVLGTGGKGAYSLSQIKAYMDANNGSFPPDLNTIASGITTSDLTNLVNQYESGKRLGGASGATIPTVASTEAQQRRQSAFDTLYSQFAQYGLEALVEPLKNLILEDVSPTEFAVRLRQTEPYRKRFAANAARINKGLKALSEGEYLALEDGYQSIMRNYGLPATYYSRGDLGRQEGFEKLISGDVSVAELEDRIATAQNRVVNAPPQVKEALQRFYPDINNSDILAYTLDPEKGLVDIKRKVTAAEIGGAALGAGLATDVARAEELAKFGVTAERARQGYQAAVPIIERGRQLSDFYQESPYTQQTAEEELFGLTYAPEATAKRKRLTSLEEAQFAGRAGMTGGALARDRAGSF